MRRDRDPSWRRIKSGPFHRIGDVYGHFFNPDHFMGRSAFDDSWLTPPANLSKNPSTYELEVALPGFSKDEIEVSLEGDTLWVKANKDDDEEYKDHYLAREMHFDTVTRHFHMDDHIDRDGISAKYENGLLKIALPHNGHSESKRKQVAVG